MSRSKAGFILPHQGVAEAAGGAVRSDVQSQINTMILQRYHMKKGLVFSVFSYSSQFNVLQFAKLFEVRTAKHDYFGNKMSQSIFFLAYLILT